MKKSWIEESDASTAAMTASVAPLPAAPWVERAPLLFFAGHVPKLYLGQTQRYELWRQLRREPGVRAISSTINCTVGAYAICRTPDRWAAEHATFCQRDCGTTRTCKGSVRARKRHRRRRQHASVPAEGVSLTESAAPRRDRRACARESTARRPPKTISR